VAGIVNGVEATGANSIKVAAAPAVNSLADFSWVEYWAAH
jgi:hypothetical protein